MRKYTVLFYAFLAFFCGVTNVAFASSCPAGQYLGRGGMSRPTQSPDFLGWVNFLDDSGWINTTNDGTIHNSGTNSGYSIIFQDGDDDPYYYDENYDDFYLVGPNNYRQWMRPGMFAAVWTSGDFQGVVIGSASCSEATDEEYVTSEVTARYCWCQADYYKGQWLTSEWVLGEDDYVSTDQCIERNWKCVFHCAQHHLADPSGFDNILEYVSTCHDCPDASFYTDTTSTTLASVANSSINSYSGADEITSCFAKPNTRFYDERGTFKYNSNCYYTK